MLTETSHQVQLDDLDHFWTAEGLPVFYANRDDICEIVEKMGFSIYYLLGRSKEVVPVKNNNFNKNSTTITSPLYNYNTEWFKVVNNFVGRTVSKVAPALSNEFIEINELAHYQMPPIPSVIIDKLDQFFRLVDAQHGTESIVMLTYDVTKQGSEGWGILVPDQENTSVHCNYDPHSIAAIKPDDVMIVGSVHSHPNMAAYASGTDHADQADFDGIHITYGWQKSINNGATQYHIELQMAGKTYTLKPEDVFENYTINKNPDPDVVEWTGKVKKELPPFYQTGVQQSRAPQQHVTTPTPSRLLTTTGVSLPTDLPYDQLPWVLKLQTVFLDCQVPNGSILLAEIDEFSKPPQYCPCCDCHIDSFNLDDGYCDTCYIPLIHKGAGQYQSLEHAAQYAAITNIPMDVPVYLFGDEGYNSLFVMPLCDDSLIDYIRSHNLNLPKDVVDKASSNIVSHEVISDYLVCCGLHEEDANECVCETRITHQDYLDFENAIQNIEIYDKNYSTPSCFECVNYYSPTCPKIKSFLADFMKDPKHHLDKLLEDKYEKIDSANCIHFEYYYSEIDSYSYYGYND